MIVAWELLSCKTLVDNILRGLTLIVVASLTVVCLTVVYVAVFVINFRIKFLFCILIFLR